ncbi:MAG: fibro-slime domain-containing protein [Planctomycetota bacterium]
MDRKATLVMLAGMCIASGASGAFTSGLSNSLPETIVLAGTVRDFQERSVEFGHADFQRRPDGGFGLYQRVVADELGEDGKPVFASRGALVYEQGRDADGRPILEKSYIDRREGDSRTRLDTNSTGSITDADSLYSWFRDVPGVNVRKSLPITLVRQAGSDTYVFDDREDPIYSGNGGFFPINGQLYGNSAGDDKNFHFTYELSTEFTYDANSEQVFRFFGDDDVWVFIDGKLVIDIGGVHGRTEQYIDLSRLDWLVDGESYTLNFFFAERHRTQSNFRIETSLRLRSVDVPGMSAIYD